MLEVYDKISFDSELMNLNNCVTQCENAIQYYDDILRYDSSEHKIKNAKKRYKFEKERLIMLEDRLTLFKQENAEYFI